MSERPPFIDQLQAKWNQGKFVCVGLDPDVARLPDHIRGKSVPYMGNAGKDFIKFTKGIIDATADLVCAYKPNSAFFERLGNGEGEAALEEIIDYIHSKYSDTPVIGDVKRADIGNTNKGYAEMAFGRFDFDAITTNPYFGEDTYEPFLEYPGKGLFILCKTTNKGAGLYQDAPIHLPTYQDLQKKGGVPFNDKDYQLAVSAAIEYSGFHTSTGDLHLPLYYLVALRTSIMARENPNIGLVVGATHPEGFAPVRRLAPDLPFLIPGIGTQGGDLEKTLKYAPNSKGQGIIINSGSAILYASSGEDFAEAAREATLKLHNQITELRAKNG